MHANIMRLQLCHTQAVIIDWLQLTYMEIVQSKCINVYILH